MVWQNSWHLRRLRRTSQGGDDIAMDVERALLKSGQIHVYTLRDGHPGKPTGGHDELRHEALRKQGDGEKNADLLRREENHFLLRLGNAWASSTSRGMLM